MSDDNPKSGLGRIIAWATAFWVPACLSGLVVALGCASFAVDHATAITAGVVVGVILGLVAISIPSVRRWFMRNGSQFPIDWQ